MVALWYHKTHITQKMSGQSDSYIIAKSGSEDQAVNLWAKRGQLMISNRSRLNTIRCFSVYLSEKALASSWTPCHMDPALGNREKLEKALCAYLNSSIGFLAILGDRTNKLPSYPRMAMRDLNRIPVPDYAKIDAQLVGYMADAYDSLCDSPLLPLPQMNDCETRRSLDDVLISALGIDMEIVATIRRELTREPSITGKPFELKWDTVENYSPQLPLWP